MEKLIKSLMKIKVNDKVNIEYFFKICSGVEELYNVYLMNADDENEVKKLLLEVVYQVNCQVKQDIDYIDLIKKLDLKLDKEVVTSIDLPAYRIDEICDDKELISLVLNGYSKIDETIINLEELYKRHHDIIDIYDGKGNIAMVNAIQASKVLPQNIKDGLICKNICYRRDIYKKSKLYKICKLYDFNFNKFKGIFYV